MELPTHNNVYGSLVCDQRLTELADLLRNFLGAGEQQVSIKTSQFDGTQKLLLRTERVEFDAYPTGKGVGELLFNGAVAGEVRDVCSFVEKLHEVLRENGFVTKLEVYDDDNKCIAAFSA